MSILENRIAVTPRVLIGIGIALIGVILMLDRIGLVDADVAFRLWPLVIVLAGISVYMRGPERAGRTNGVILMVVGSWLLLSSIGVIRVSFWQLFWPLVLIAIGTGLVMQTLHHREARPSLAGNADWVTMVAVLGGVNRMSASQRFRGGDLAAFMGGGRLDLRQANIAPGEEAMIDLLTVMGGFEIFVPPTWTVATPAVPFMASIEDHRAPAVPNPAAAAEPAPRLVIRGFLMMSGVQIRT
jgi:predicted membrane protein